MFVFFYVLSTFQFKEWKRSILLLFLWVYLFALAAFNIFSLSFVSAFGVPRYGFLCILLLESSLSFLNLRAVFPHFYKIVLIISSHIAFVPFFFSLFVLDYKYTTMRPFDCVSHLIFSVLFIPFCSLCLEFRNFLLACQQDHGFCFPLVCSLIIIWQVLNFRYLFFRKST